MSVSNGSIISAGDVVAILGETSNDNDTIISLSIRRAEGAVKRFLKYDPVKRARTEFYPQSTARERSGLVLESTDTHAIFTNPESVRGNELQLQHIPIRSDTAIQIWVDFGAKAGTKSGSFAASTKKTEGTDYWANYDANDSDGNAVCRDGIIRAYGLWPIEPGSIKVTYTAGYTSAEFRGTDSLIDASPIWDAALEEAVQRARKAILSKKSTKLGYLSGPVIEEKLGDYSYKVSDSISKELFGVAAFDLLTESMSKLQDFAHYGVEL